MTQSRLRWACRRGLKELDEQLLGYLETHYPAASPVEQACFADWLTLSDPELWARMSGRLPEDPVARRLAMKLRGCRDSSA